MAHRNGLSATNRQMLKRRLLYKQNPERKEILVGKTTVSMHPLYKAKRRQMYKQNKGKILQARKPQTRLK